MHARFGLTLMVNHACNLRCTYCYTGAKFHRPMPLAVGQRAIDRGLAALAPGGTLELGFFGGEPLIEADSIHRFIEYAADHAAARGTSVTFALTTNGTIDTPAAWSVMTLPQMRLAISHDGIYHDRHRLSSGGAPTSDRVLATIRRLRDEKKDFRVVLVVRPDNVADLAASLAFLYEHGVRQFDPSLDLWARWTVRDGKVLAESIRESAEFWAARLPECGVSWFDEKAARLARVPTNDTSRCGFGHREIAVAPSGNLYPCERLIGADEPSNSMRLGHVNDGHDFLGGPPPAFARSDGCTGCTLQAQCSTTCRCSNFVRTGDVHRPDGLLCLWDQTCLRETIRALEARCSPCTR